MQFVLSAVRQNSTMSQIGDSGESCGGGLRTEHVTLTLFSPTHRTVTKKLGNILTATIIYLILFIIIIFFMSECQHYGSLNNADRKITYGRISYQCDSGIGPGWFRFEGSAGTRMPTSCPPMNRCNTHLPGWMNGGHPTVADGQVSRQVCFNWGNCCNLSTNIKVRNCGSYYVYYLNSTPNGGYCNLRYCGAD